MCLVVAVALAFALPAIQSSRQNAYLKPYETKYGIHYPAGMLEQYCDAYGKDRQIAGFLTYGSSGEITVSKTKMRPSRTWITTATFCTLGLTP